MPLIIENPTEIKTTASDVIRYAANADDRFLPTFMKLTEIGVKSPGYTKVITRKALCDRFDNEFEKAYNGEVAYKDFISKFQELEKLMAFTWARFTNSEFVENFSKLYPKTATKRLAIEQCLSESTKHPYQLCTQRKGLKKFYNFLFKLTSKKI